MPSRPDALLSLEELATAIGITRSRLTRLVHLGVVDTAGDAPARFTASTALRLRRMLRLRRDLGVNLAGAVIIVDLVERLDRVQAERGGPV